RLEPVERGGLRLPERGRGGLGAHAGVEEHVADARDADELDAVAGDEAGREHRGRAERLDALQVDALARVAGRVGVGDVLAVDVERLTLGDEGRQGRREAGEGAHHSARSRIWKSPPTFAAAPRVS